MSKASTGKRPYAPRLKARKYDWDLVHRLCDAGLKQRVIEDRVGACPGYVGRWKTYSGYGTIRKQFPWTRNEEEALTSLLRKGFSMAQAAKALARTRNSVIGKIHRHGGVVAVRTGEAWQTRRSY